MPENIRHQPATPLPANPERSQGSVGNVGADAGSQINPQPAVGIQPPSNPANGQGAVSNVGADSGSQIRPQG
jgi:hypothetical protein